MKLAEHRLRSELGKFRCPMCQNESEFDFLPEEFQILGYDIDEKEVKADSSKASYIPVIVNICPKCGYVAHFNLRQGSLLENLIVQILSLNVLPEVLQHSWGELSFCTNLTFFTNTLPIILYF